MRVLVVAWVPPVLLLLVSKTKKSIDLVRDVNGGNDSIQRWYGSPMARTGSGRPDTVAVAGEGPDPGQSKAAVWGSSSRPRQRALVHPW